ncbi:hypothetical protein [Microbispora sp. NBC_01389]|uniref:hypothetical protein n=1 Tax=Microbispora sp. NBC_01389 TaxID=2903584 RepID=UPI003255B0CE
MAKDRTDFVPHTETGGEKAVAEARQRNQEHIDDHRRAESYDGGRVGVSARS